MLKNHFSQKHSNPQIQTPPMPSTYAYTLDEEGSGSRPASTSGNELEDDDDDICPVCESECTCSNRRNNTSPPSTTNFSSGYVSPTAFKAHHSSVPPQSAVHPSLKIKLTLPPKPHSSTGNISKLTSGRSNAFKKKSKNLTETISADGSVGGAASVISSLSSGQGPVTSDVNGMQFNAGGSIPKKRGRPTKAVIAAREAAKAAKLANAVIDQSSGNVVDARQEKQTGSRNAIQKKSISSGASKKGKKLHGAAAASRAKAQQRKAQEKTRRKHRKHRSTLGDGSSELSEPEDEDETDDLHPFGLPTFVSAFSSSSNSSSSESDSDTDSASEKDIPPIPCSRNVPPYKPMSDGNSQRKRGQFNNWEIHVRKRSVGAEGSSDAGVDTDSDEEEEEDEEEEGDAGDNDDETDLGGQHLTRYSGIATGWTDDEEESSFDADLFFANLSDSTAYATDDERMDDTENDHGDDDGQNDDEMSILDQNISPGGFDVMRLSEVAAAGFLAPFAELERSGAGTESLPFGQGWDHLPFFNAKDAVQDVESRTTRESLLSSALSLVIPGYEDADAMMATSEEEEAVAMFDNCSQDFEEEDGLEIFEGSDGGETTEDEFVDVDGIATPRHEVLLRFPASLGAIDPMSTVSSPAKAPAGRVRSIATISSPMPKKRERAKQNFGPTEILSGNFSRVDKEDVHSNQIPTTKESPVMGSFMPQALDNRKCVVITSSGSTSSGGIIPCPFPAVRRLRRRCGSLNMPSHNGSDRLNASRPSSCLSATRSPFDTVPGHFECTNDVDLRFGEPIKLDDVIDTALLEPESSDIPIPDSTTSEIGEPGETGESDSEHTRHIESLRRWDRIPIDAFRRSRAASTASDLALVQKMNVATGTPRAPRPSDGFSYGSAGGGSLRGGSLGTALWELGCGGVSSGHERGSGHGVKDNKLSSLLISPVLLPSRDGDRTPTNGQHQHQQHQAYLGFGAQHAAHHALNAKSRKELRKEKKRNRKFLGPAVSHRHNHFPNSKSRGSGSMQRSSSIPSLSI